MTARQRNFIRRLAEQERQLPDPASADEYTRLRLSYLKKVLTNEADPAPDKASRIIDWLLTMPVRADAPPQQRSTRPAVEVAEGRYALVEDGTVRFYVVDRPTEGRWAGYTFVNAQASDERHPIRNRETRARILAAIAADPREAMQRYAAELGRCGYCGRTLTDETSRAAGIGPDCAQRHGVDRSQWAVAAERVRAEAETRRGGGDAEDWRADTPADQHPDVFWGNEFGRYEAAQERAAYEAEMAHQGV